MAICAEPKAVADIPTLGQIELIFTRFVNILLAFGGVLFFVMFIVGGFRYLTSGGDQKTIAAAHITLTYAALGLVFVVLSYSILAFIEFITGADVSTFQIVQC